MSIIAKLRSFLDIGQKVPKFWAPKRRIETTAAPRVRALVAHAEIDKPDDLDRLLAPMPHPAELRKILAAHTAGHYWIYDEKSVVARYIWTSGKEVVVFSLVDISKQQAVRVGEECAKITLIDDSTFRAAVFAAIGLKL